MLHSCETPGLLPIQAAISNMLKNVNPVSESEWVDIEEASERVLAEDIISTINVPPADNSAMDGYALRHEDLFENNQLTLVGTALAGSPYNAQVSAGQCVRIMTGAIIPEGADAVVMQENTNIHDKQITFKQIPKLGNSIRRAGEDIKKGQMVIEKGTQLTPAYLALIASIGISEVAVIRRVKVGLIATGDELTPPGEALVEGAIYESNRYALTALLSTFAVEIFDFGIIKDNKEQLKTTFEQAGSHCDLVISCGGVSVGEADYVKEILDQLGQINFWKVAIKPGKPFAFGQLNNALFCGLPGNPVSSYVTFETLVTPLLNQLCGAKIKERPYFIAKAACTIYKRPGRADYQRGIFYRDDNGELVVKPNGKQGSGIMSSIANANCYILLGQDSGNLEQGNTVKIQPF
ncbi:molybdopterin molybdotransferase MoeA [uncultured Paraglaciecola sp.]|uniref:molybdopterin molybdotransferase MoeA n=1 Tax=uncultured Paraglaciecola sp. TaxID=1765024 RepID=UPI002594A427|nr:molybdopterin molybdotransferase MoeA [uncultured Paraglaciecola sp.]